MSSQIKPHVDTSKVLLFPFFKLKNNTNELKLNDLKLNFSPLNKKYFYSNYKWYLKNNIATDPISKTNSKKLSKKNKKIVAVAENDALKKANDDFFANTKANQKTDIFNNVKVYPNPVQSQLNISYLLNKNVKVEIKIIDLLGNEVTTFSHKNEKQGNNSHSFNLNGKVNGGTYFVKLMTEDSVKLIRIIVQ